MALGVWEIPDDQTPAAVEVGIKNYDEAEKSIDKSLSKMNLDYLDMMIIHNPQPWNEVNQ